MKSERFTFCWIIGRIVPKCMRTNKVKIHSVVFLCKIANIEKQILHKLIVLVLNSCAMNDYLFTVSLYINDVLKISIFSFLQIKLSWMS